MNYAFSKVTSCISTDSFWQELKLKAVNTAPVELWQIPAMAYQAFPRVMSVQFKYARPVWMDTFNTAKYTLLRIPFECSRKDHVESQREVYFQTNLKWMLCIF